MFIIMNNRKDIHGQTVLHYAAKSGNIKCLKLLLECGVNIHAKVRDKRIFATESAFFSLLFVTIGL